MIDFFIVHCCNGECQFAVNDTGAVKQAVRVVLPYDEVFCEELWGGSKVLRSGILGDGRFVASLKEGTSLVQLTADFILARSRFFN